MQLCELRDNQLDMADCLHDIELRIQTLQSELAAVPVSKTATEPEKNRRQLMEKILAELMRSKLVYEVSISSSFHWPPKSS